MLIALFGLGAAAGLALLQWSHADSYSALRLAVVSLGIIISTMSLSPSVLLAFVGATAFGGAAAVAVTSSMSYLQQELRGRELVLAFTAFHVVIRGGLALAAIGAGAAADLVGRTHWPLFGDVPSTRVVLFFSGCVVLISGLALRSAIEAAEAEGDVGARGMVAP